MQLLAFISKSRNYFSWYDVPVDILSYIDLPINPWILEESINTKLERLVDEIMHLATTRDENWFLECLRNAYLYQISKISLMFKRFCLKYQISYEALEKWWISIPAWDEDKYLSFFCFSFLYLLICFLFFFSYPKFGNVKWWLTLQHDVYNMYIIMNDAVMYHSLKGPLFHPWKCPNYFEIKVTFL